MEVDLLPGTAQGWCTAQVVSFCISNELHTVPCAIPLLLHHVSLSHLTLVGRDYPSEQYAAMCSAGETRAQVAMTVFDDNATEGIENFTAALNLSEYTLSLGVRLNQNSSTAIIYIEDNGESVGSHHWYATLPGIQVVHVLYCTHCTYVLSFTYLGNHCSPF